MCHKSELDKQEIFTDTIKQLGDNAILILLHDDDRPEAVFISPQYAAMMEDSRDNLKRFNRTGDFRELIHPEDRHLVDYMLENHESPDENKSQNIQIRLIKAHKNIIW